MMQLFIKALFQCSVPLLFLLPSSCDVFTDSATRLASDLKYASKQLTKEGDKFTLRHNMPSRRDECDGPYTVQLDKVGALVFWCKDETGEVLSSPATSSHRPFVETPKTYYLQKQAGETLVIQLEQQGSRAVIVDAY